MSTSGDFPGSCPTNTYILPDFGEVAYIVCTVSVPPSTNVPPPTPESSLARMKHTEKQFRQASILAVLDPESLQLFTFYKKVDVMKDQRALLSRFTSILRSNSCTIAYKAAARVPDLLKPEHSRLYRLFVSAILANIKLVVEQPKQVLPLDQRCFVIEEGQASEITSPSNPVCGILRPEIQLISSGHVVLTFVRELNTNLISMLHYDLEAVSMQQIRIGIPVLLSPVGHLAVYRGGYIGHHQSAQGQTPGKSKASDLRGQLNVWRTKILTWLKDDQELDCSKETEFVWIELELPVREPTSKAEDSEENEHNTDREQDFAFAFRTFFWPAHLSFAFKFGAADRSGPDSLVNSDPIGLIQQWIDTAEERAAEAASRSLQKEALDQIDEQDLFDDEDGMDQTGPFPSFGPPAFPASQTVYPTPPDVVMAHATPGMSSIDGIVATPVTNMKFPIEKELEDHEMTDIDPENGPAVESSFYEDDLFDEMSEDGFDQATNGKEPNWDFFDEHDKKDESSKSPNPEQTAVAEQGDDDETDPGVTQGLAAGISAEAQASVVDETLPAPDTDTLAQPDQKTSTMIEGDESDLRAENARDLDFETVAASKQGQHRRRSSTYDNVAATRHMQSRDTRYSRSGEFWFDLDRHGKPEAKIVRVSGENAMTRTSSSTSESDISTPGSTDTGKLPSSDELNVPAWTRYEKDALGMKLAEEVPDIDLKQIQREVDELFSLIKVNQSLLPLSAPPKFPRSTVGTSLPTPEARMMLAQTLLDQLTQSSLFRNMTASSPPQSGGRTTADIEVDMQNLNCDSEPASLARLSSISNTTIGQVTGNIDKLPDSEISMRRTDKTITSSTSIFSFWDTLGLQPRNSPKDVVAFCLHPPGTAIEDGCMSFLERIADAYTSSNLGTHRIGQLPEVTFTGLVPCTFDKSRSAEFVQLLRKFVDTLGNSSQVSGNIVMYIVSPSDASNSLIMCVSLFLSLFKSLGRLLATRQEHTDLVLQIVPASFIASPNTIVVPSQQEFNQLALELYSRIPPEGDKQMPGRCDYPIVLSDTSPGIEFNLETKLASPLHKDGPCLHLAYAYSEDRSWIVASWSDEKGFVAHSTTYQTGARQNATGRSQQEMFQDMWDVSHDLMKKQRGRWRLVICQSDSFEIEEINAWSTLANAESNSSTSRCTMYLIRVELQPTVEIRPPGTRKAIEPQSAIHAHTYNTPAATPQQITTSPEQISAATPTPGGTALNAPTPPEHGFDANADTEIILGEPSEESWTVVLPFGLNQAGPGQDLRPSTASGYLVKRAGAKYSDSVVHIGVHLVHPHPHSQPNTSQNSVEETLKEIISQYRGLVTLAALRGCIDKVRDCIPWHVHTAVRGARLLENLL